VRVLGIETSCDETAAAVVEDGRSVCSSVVSSQVEVHARFGGVVPEVAGRAHVEAIGPVVRRALGEAGLPVGVAGTAQAPVDAVAVTHGPGLVGCLLVGLSTAKSLAMGWDVPLVGVNHLEAHLFASLIEEPELEPPLVVLLVSGGHTLLVLMEAPGRYHLLGETLDDAAGEAYDKIARYLGLGYPGGPAIDRVAAEGDPGRYALPRALLDEGYDFSFSGLKTAVVRLVERERQAPTVDVAASFQQAVVDVLVTKSARAVIEQGARGLCLAGGVAANSHLRRRAQEVGRERGFRVAVPSPAMCTDNAAMVAAAGAWRLAHDGPSPWALGAEPNLALPVAG
jgi:N6-L-threonylcarbamoyladenine synthase